MAAPLNVFKTYSSNLTTANTTIYTAPIGYTTVCLLAQASNISGGTIGVSAYHIRGNVGTSIISNVQIPVNDAVNLLSGKLILQTADYISVKCSGDDSAQLLLSILETAN